MVLPKPWISWCKLPGCNLQVVAVFQPKVGAQPKKWQTAKVAGNFHESFGDVTRNIAATWNFDGSVAGICWFVQEAVFLISNAPSNLTPDILPRQCSSGKKDPQKKMEQHVFYWSRNGKSLTSFILFLSLSHEPVSSKHFAICSKVLCGRSSWMVFIVIPLSIFSAMFTHLNEWNGWRQLRGWWGVARTQAHGAFKRNMAWSD